MPSRSSTASRASAARLCGGQFCGVYRVQDGQLGLVAHHNAAPEGLDTEGRASRPPLAGAPFVVARVVREQRVINIADVETEPEVLSGDARGGPRAGLSEPPRRADAPGRGGHRLHRRGQPLGAAVHGQAGGPAPDIRRSGGDCDRECPAVPGAAGADRRARDRQPPQERVPRQYVPRAADAVERRHRLLRGAARADVRRAQRQAGRSICTTSSRRAATCSR